MTAAREGIARNASNGGAHVVVTTQCSHHHNRPAWAGPALASPACELAKTQPARRIIVDAHVHIWLADTPERPWPADGIGQAHIPRPFSYYELLSS